MDCLTCKGTLEDRNRAFMVELDRCIVIVKNVPAQVCAQCGEVSYSDEVMRKLESMVAAAKNSVTEIAILDYAGQVA